MEIHFTGGQRNWAACHVELYGSDMGGNRTVYNASGEFYKLAVCVCH